MQPPPPGSIPPITPRKKGFPVWIIVVAVLAVPATCLFWIVVAIATPNFIRARENARLESTLIQGRNLGYAMRMYAEDHNLRLPLAKNWETAVSTRYMEGEPNFQVPAAVNGDEPGRFTMNVHFSGFDIKTDNNADKTAAIFLTGTTRPNASGRGRHALYFPYARRMLVISATGEMMLMKEGETDTLRWTRHQPFAQR